jgi:aminopeptidase N
MKARGRYPGVPLVVKAAAALVLWAPLSWGQVPPGHRLPEGAEHPVRERDIDVERLALDLRLDMDAKSVAGSAAITFSPLREGLASLSLDAADLEVSEVQLSGKPAPFEVGKRSLRVSLPAPMEPGQAATLVVRYSAPPRCGLYFQPASGSRSAQAWNYGEGGLHYGWLPLYNDTNDRFAVDMKLTVPRPLVALSNGLLKATVENPDGTRTFHWVQEEPIPNYLIALDVGDFVRVPLGEVRLGDRRVPVGAWGPPGKEAALGHVFGETPKMIEFFSSRFGVPYPWSKYDQVLLHEFQGAMETTTMVGFSESYARLEGDPPDGGPEVDEPFPGSTPNDTVSHELAHHWFGDFVTCRSLGSIWLNESFATFAQALWRGHASGEDDLVYLRWRRLDKYLRYVRRTGTVRPMEYLRYTDPKAIYQSETTYIKGSLVLHMLQHFLGDRDFFRGVHDYLSEHAFGTADSADLEESLLRSTGRNLGWFFDDWVRGGGHPSFKVEYSWSPERKEVDLSVEQVQADLPFENVFHLPVEVEVVTASGTTVRTLRLEDWSTKVSLPSETRPLAVVFDKGNWLVAELRFERPLEERLYLLDHGAPAEKLRAARQITEEHPRRPETVQGLARLLADRRAHWGLRQEAARDLGVVSGDAALDALLAAASDTDRLVRRAAALALAEAGGPRAAAALRERVERDEAEDVVASAAYGLGRMRAPGAAEFLKAQLSRESRWWEVIRTGALKGLTELADPALAGIFPKYLDPEYPRQLRLAALQGWFRSAPGDPALAPRLRELAGDRSRSVREEALEKLGALHRAEDVAFLATFAEAEPDPSLARKASDARKEIEAFTTRQ